MRYCIECKSPLSDKGQCDLCDKVTRQQALALARKMNRDCGGKDWTPTAQPPTDEEERP